MYPNSNNAYTLPQLQPAKTLPGAQSQQPIQYTYQLPQVQPPQLQLPQYNIPQPTPSKNTENQPANPPSTPTNHSRAKAPLKKMKTKHVSTAPIYTRVFPLCQLSPIEIATQHNLKLQTINEFINAVKERAFGLLEIFSPFKRTTFEQFQEGIKQIGFQSSFITEETLFKKYSENQVLDWDGFIMCCCYYFKVFREFNKMQTGGKIEITWDNAAQMLVGLV
ncbi:Hypothetical_protein [Hexamita inflata]|uniref:Hypothetical_protein n=1 Tax=Hexamita inflata TaxID=28002 RepID=A0ABP1GEK9_9EUKA